MEKKNSRLSLIFPMISFVGALILLLIVFETAVDEIGKAFFIAFAVCAVLPLPSVLFLKTDISRFLKLQIIFTIVSLICCGWYILTVLSIVLIFVGLFVFGIAASLTVVLTCVILYTRAAKRETDRKALKFFTALLSTPALYISIYSIMACTEFCLHGISGLAHIG